MKNKKSKSTPYTGSPFTNDLETSDYNSIETKLETPIIPPEKLDLLEESDSFDAEHAKKQIKKFEKKSVSELQNFTDLLKTLSTVEEKQKSLWRTIFENAAYDRHNAHMMWANLYMHVFNNPTEHAIHGQNLSKYLERMSKANDQLVKLAQLVNDAAQGTIEETVTEEDMYKTIQNMNKKN